ncbi:MAG: trypsin-like peptidase domain-containing protein [bacterium]|nr:trypsin-like peptidase domain-containing protein [bacterium]
MTRKFALVSAVVALLLPTLSSAAIDTNLRYGAKGEKVRELQVFLISRGFLSGEATGNFYGLTLKAVKVFQTSEQLPSTGFVGPMTRAAISKKSIVTPLPVASPASTSNPVLGGLMAHVKDLLKQIDTMSNRGIATSSLRQTYAVNAQQFDFNPAWRDAIVNLYCMPPQGSMSEASSGSGVMIDPRGIILTNAHVASNFLYADWPKPSLLVCSVRIGSPARPQYRAALLYIPDWYMMDEINHAYKYVPEEVFLPYLGRKDYALLVITGPTSASVTMPAAFPYLDIYQGGVLPVKTPVYLSGYSAEFLDGELLHRDLYQLSTPTVVGAQQPLGTSTVPQAIAFSGSISSQHGASGGAVIAEGGTVAGLMTFLNKDYGHATSERVLSAITTDYIMKDFLADRNMTLQAYIAASDPIGLSKTFMAEHGSRYQQMHAKIWKEKGFAVPGLY